MKKGLIAALTAALVLSMSSLTVFAASPTVGTTASPVATQKATTSIAAVASAEAFASSTTVDAAYKISAVSESTVSSATVAVQNLLLNDLATTGAVLGSKDLQAAATKSNKKVTATLRTVVDVTPVTATKNAAGLYDYTLQSSFIKAGKVYAGLHFNGTAWEVIVPTAVADGAISFSSNLSPVAVVELSVDGAAKSPKTGETFPVAMMIVLLGVAGAAVCTRKVFA